MRPPPARTWVLALTALALAVRLPGLNGGMWVDEIYSLIHSFRLPLVDIVTVFPRDNHHPLYAVLAHLARAVFGEAPWVIRLPALLFGAASVPLLYLLGRQVASARESLAAAALLAVSYHHVWFSQNARGYTPLACFAILCTWLLLRGMATHGRGWYLAYAAAAALGAWTHLTMVFVVVGHAIVCAAQALRPAAGAPARSAFLKGPMLAFVLAGAGTALLYAPVLAQVGDYFANKPSGLAGVSTPRWAIVEGLRVLAAGFGAAKLALAIPVLLAGAAVFAAGAWSYARRTPLVFALFVAPGFVTIAGALAARGTMYPRFFFSLIGFGLLIAVRGIDLLAERIGRGDARRAERTFAGLAGVAIVLSLVSLARVWSLPKQDFGGALAYVESHAAPGDVIATVGVTRFPYRELYRRQWTEIEDSTQLAAARGRGTRVWLVYTFPRYLERFFPQVWAAIRRDCPRAAVFPGTVGGGDLTVCSFASPQGDAAPQ